MFRDFEMICFRHREHKGHGVRVNKIFISYYKLIVQTISPCPLWILWYESLSGSNFSSHKHNIRDSKTDNCCCN